MSLQLFYTDKVPSELRKLAVICHEGNNTQLTNDILFSGLDATGPNKFEIWQTTSEVHDNSFKDLLLFKVPSPVAFKNQYLKFHH